MVGARVRRERSGNLVEQMVEVLQAADSLIKGDADLDSLGRDDFWDLSEKLHAELKHFGQTITEDEWRLRQIEFLQNHSYFTEASRQLRHTGKAANLQKLKDMVDRRAGCFQG